MAKQNKNVENIFKELAQESTSLCKLQSGREKMDTDDIIGKPVTIIAFDFAPKFDKEGNQIFNEDGTPDTYAVFVFAEHPDMYYNAGIVLTKVARAWAEAYEGDYEAASAALEEAGGVQIEVEMGRTNGGKNLAKVTIL